MTFSQWFIPWVESSVAYDTWVASGLPSTQIMSRQSYRLQHLLGSARQHSPFYRDHLRYLPDRLPAGSEALADLPAIKRHTLMEQFDRWCTDPKVTRQETEQFVANPNNIASPFLDEYSVWESSGTHGEPGYFVQDSKAMAIYDSLEGIRHSNEHWWRYSLYGERIAFVGALGGHFASTVSIERLRRLYPWLAQSIQSFSIMQPVEKLVDELNAFKPKVIATYPSAAALLADQAETGQLITRPEQVWTGGETLSRSVRQHIEDCLNCTVRNSYGASEFLTIGWECYLGKMHLNADWVVLEPVDKKGRPLPPDTQPATTLITNLANHLQPLIRYDIGDKVMVASEACLCGSSYPVIDVLGRDDDVLVMSGKRKGSLVKVLPLALMTALEEDARVFDFQVLQQDSHTLLVRLASADPVEKVAAHQRCQHALHKFAATQGLAPIQLITENGQPLAHGRSGKVRRVVSSSEA